MNLYIFMLVANQCIVFLKLREKGTECVFKIIFNFKFILDNLLYY